MDQKLSLSDIKNRVVKSFLSLSLRQVLLRALSFVTINIILAKVLPVETLGIFNVASAVVTFFAFFSDVGLAASLIQKKESLKKEDISTTFTIQFIIVGLLCLFIFLVARPYANFNQIEEAGVWLIRVLAISFFISSFKVIPSVLLERQLKFEPLVIVELVETVVFNGLLIVLVFLNFNLWAFSLAALSRGLVGVMLLYILHPVELSFGINKQAAKSLLSFGVPFQLNNLLALVKDRLVPLVLTKIVGTVGIGYITWAQNMAFLPLEIMSIIIRITFPAFSRLQDNKEALSRALEKSLFVTAFFVYPILFGIAAILPSIISIVVSEKWLPALPSYYLFAVSAYFAVISTTFTNTLNAIGNIKTSLKLMVFWTVATWVLTPLLSLKFGFTGMALSSFIISFSSIITIFLVKRILQVKVLEAILLPTIASLLMAAVVFWLSNYFVKDTFTLIIDIGIGAVLYLTCSYLIGKERLMSTFRTVISREKAE